MRQASTLDMHGRVLYTDSMQKKIQDGRNAATKHLARIQGIIHNSDGRRNRYLRFN